MATVRHTCGECGADVQRGDVRCRACGKGLEWGDGRPAVARPARAKRSKQADVGAPGRRRVEPWQIISIIAVGALIVFLVWSELSREHAAPATTVAKPSMPLESPVAAARVDLAPLEDAVKANPKDADAVLRLANALHDNGMLPRAIEHYKNYLSMHPENPDARVDLGICYDQMGMIDSLGSAQYYALAIKEMDRALKGNPSHQPAAFNLGIVNLHRGELEESNKWLKKAAAMNKNSDLGMRAQQILQQHSFTP
jgi:hypothetical protein